MQKELNKQERRSKLPLLVGLLFMLTLVVYTSTAYFTDNFSTDSSIAITVGKLKIESADTYWKMFRNGRLYWEKNNGQDLNAKKEFSQVLPGDEFKRTISVKNSGDLPAVMSFKRENFNLIGRENRSWVDFVEISAKLNENDFYSSPAQKVKVPANESVEVILSLKLRNDLTQEEYAKIQGKKLDLDNVSIAVESQVDYDANEISNKESGVLVFNDN